MFVASNLISRVQSCLGWRLQWDLITGLWRTNAANRLNFDTYQFDEIRWKVGGIAEIPLMRFLDWRARGVLTSTHRRRRGGYWDRLIENILGWREEIVHRLFSSNENKNKVIRRVSFASRRNFKAEANRTHKNIATIYFEWKFALLSRGCRDSVRRYHALIRLNRAT